MRLPRPLLVILAVTWWVAVVAAGVATLFQTDALILPVLAIPGYGTVGGLLAIRRPYLPFGWLLLAMASSPLIGFVIHVVEVQNGIPVSGLALLLVLFPTGSPPSRRWLIPMVLVVVSWVGLGVLGHVRIREGLEVPLGVIVAVGSLLVCGAAPFVRYRRATGVERAQLQSLGAASGITALAVLLVGVAAATDFPLLAEFAGVIASVGFAVGIPGAIFFAVLKHRLYEIDQVFGRAVTYGLVAVVLAVAYVAAVVGIGALARLWIPEDKLGVPLPIVATALVSLAFHPVRVRATRVAERMVYGRKRTPYEALVGIRGASIDEALPELARIAVEATRARRAVAWLSNGVELRPAAIFPEEGMFPAAVPLEGGVVPETLAGETAFPLRHDGALLGVITVATDPGESLSADDRRLLIDFASHASTTLFGIVHATPLPAGTVTFLMTDIEGSTRLWEDDAEAMSAAIQRHDHLAREVVGKWGGVLIKWRGEGDSTFSVFTDAAGGVQAAAELQRVLGAEAWPTSRPIRVRAALHTGEAELRERDYFGRTVNRCARLRAIATGGQVLLSAATREVCRDGLPDSLRVSDLGERRLKDMADTEHVYELVVAEPIATAGT